MESRYSPEDIASTVYIEECRAPTLGTRIHRRFGGIYSLRLQTNKQKTPWPLVRKRTIPTERRLLVGDI
jgi:hypothetical protein